MASVIDTLFNNNRFKQSSGLVYLMFFLYIPVAIVLFTLRILVSFQYLLVIILLPKQWLVRRIIARIFLFCMGIHVSCHGTRHKKNEAKFLVSNNLTLFDVLAIEVIWPIKQMNIAEIPNWLSAVFKLKISDNNISNGDNFPILVFPEQTPTNGKVGLLKFSVDVFEKMDGLIQPIVLTVNRPWFIPVHPNYLMSSFASDLFWVLYTPFTHFNICYLPVRDACKEKEELETFVKSLQKDMAFVLEKEATNLTIQDKKELIKRIKTEEQRKEQARLNATSAYHQSINRALSSNSSNQRMPQLEALQMIEQIKNVLPQVPVKVIQKELEVVNNVDTTISLLLDGTIVYTPLTEEEQSQEKKLIDEKRKSLKMKSSKNSISDNWKDRQLSFQEKKRIMIEEARRKYLELHPEYT